MERYLYAKNTGDRSEVVSISDDAIVIRPATASILRVGKFRRPGVYLCPVCYDVLFVAIGFGNQPCDFLFGLGGMRGIVFW